MRSPSELDTQTIDGFIAWYKENIPNYRDLAQKVHDICNAALQCEGVLCRFEHRAKDPERLRAKLVARQQNQKREYEDRDEILKDIVDLVGARIIVYIPMNKGRIDGIITKSFKFRDLKPFPEKKEGLPEKEEGVNEPDKYSPDFDEYRANHYRVYLKEKDIPLGKGWQNVVVEIQVVSILRHALAEIGHDMIYKSLQPTSLQARKLFDTLNGHIAVAEHTLDQLHDLQVQQQQAENAPFESQYELAPFLWGWAKSHGKHDDLGDVHSLLNLMQSFDLNTPKRAREILNQLSFSSEQRSSHPSLIQGRMPASFDIATCMMDHIIWSEEGRRKLADKKALAADDAQGQRYKLEVIVGAFIWLDELFNKTDWVGIFLGNGGNETCSDQKRRITWLDTRAPQNFYKKSLTLSPADEEKLHGLWTHFANHSARPIQFAFNLASVGVGKGCPPNWHALNQAIGHLTTLSPNGNYAAL